MHSRRGRSQAPFEVRGAGAKGGWRAGGGAAAGEGGGGGPVGGGGGSGGGVRGGGSLAEAAQSLGPLTEGLGLFGTHLEGGAGGAGAYLPPLHSAGSSQGGERALSERAHSEGPADGMLSSQGSILSDESDTLGRAMALLDLERQGLSSSDAGLSTPEDSLPRHQRLTVPSAGPGRATTPSDEAEWRHIPGLPAKTGTGYRLCENPLKDMLHVRGLPPEPLEEPDPGIVEQMVMHDAERIQVPGNVRNFVVYDAHHTSTSKSDGGTSDAAGGGESSGSNVLPSNYEPRGSDDHTLVFNSRFESGNLRRAIKVYDYEYDLILRPDLNTRGHTQWFYFSVSNTRRNQSYKLNIINLCKEESLYQEGMRPLLYSVKDSVARGTSWKRVGERICYYQNTIKRKCGKSYSTLTMTLRFEHDHDTVHLAHCYPYTYSDLQRYLHALEMDPARGQHMRRRALCKTLAGNNCDLLTITSFAADQNARSVRARKAVVLSARVHPGETNASWMMRGVLQFLTGPSFEAQLLRKNFIFKVIPMLNPDGVVNGNYRCSLTGDDLNRCWLDPSKKLHPTIWHTKAMIKKLQEDREVLMFCDFHGHSRKRNIFVYGCERKERDGGFNLGFPSYRIMEKVFPKILSDTAPDLFSMHESSFKVQKSKESTARVVCWRELGLTNSYTLEATFAGADCGAYAGMHFQTSHLEDMGEAFCKALLDFCNPDDQKIQSVYRELELMFPPRVSSLVSTYSAVDSRGSNSKLADLSRDQSVHGSPGLGFGEGDEAGSEDTDDDSDVENQKGKKERRRRNSSKKAVGSSGSRASKGTNSSGKAKTSQSKVKGAPPKGSAVKRSDSVVSKKTKSKPAQKQGGSVKSRPTDSGEGIKKKRPSLEHDRVKGPSGRPSERAKGSGAGGMSGSDSKFSGVRLLKGHPRFPVGSGYVR